MTCPMSSYLEQQLQKRFTLFRLWESRKKAEFLKQNSESIKAVVGNTVLGADSELVDSLPRLEIVSSYSVGLDKIDLVKCKERGIKVTNTPDVLTDDVADLTIGLALATLRKISVADGFVRNGLWKNCDFELSTRVCRFSFLSLFENKNTLPHTLVCAGCGKLLSGVYFVKLMCIYYLILVLFLVLN